jgi:hypothetical protein
LAVSCDVALHLALAAVLLLAGQRLPATRAIVASVSRYVAQYQHEFVSLVADESTTQQVIVDGVVTETRTTRGEMFATFIESDRAWMTVHDIADVDGGPVANRDDVRAMLLAEPLRAIAPRVAAANARYNIGHVTRNFNEPTLALVLFTPARLDDLRVERAAADREAARDADAAASAGCGGDCDTLVTLRFRSRDGRSIVRSAAGPVATRGSAVVEAAGGRVRRTIVTFDDRHVEATLDTTYGLDAHVAFWVPVTFVERYVAHETGEQTLVRSAFTNYRRFETTGRMVR